MEFSPDRTAFFKRFKERWRDSSSWKKGRALFKKDPELLHSPRSFCFFIGYPRSGHSLVGSLLDAHPDVALAHEQDTLKYIYRGIDREDLFSLLIGNAIKVGERGRRQTGYSYVVPGQYQGMPGELRVIGDKRGGNSSRWLRSHPELLGRLRELLQEELRVIHVSRHPLDNIATMAYRYAKGRPEKMTQEVLQAHKEKYMSLARTVERTRQELKEEEFHHLYLETLIDEPQKELRELLSFLELEAYEGYLSSCQDLLYQKPSRSRNRFHWPETLLRAIREEIAELPCLAKYEIEVDG